MYFDPNVIQDCTRGQFKISSECTFGKKYSSHGIQMREFSIRNLGTVLFDFMGEG